MSERENTDQPPSWLSGLISSSLVETPHGPTGPENLTPYPFDPISDQPEVAYYGSYDPTTNPITVPLHELTDSVNYWKTLCYDQSDRLRLAEEKLAQLEKENYNLSVQHQNDRMVIDDLYDDCKHHKSTLNNLVLASKRISQLVLTESLHHNLIYFLGTTER